MGPYGAITKDRIVSGPGLANESLYALGLAHSNTNTVNIMLENSVSTAVYWTEVEVEGGNSLKVKYRR
jgi:hypothetical protein